MRHPPKWLRALGNTGDGIFVVDATQRIVFWNKGAERLLGYSEAEVLNRRCHQVIAGRLRDKLFCRAHCKVQRCVQHGLPLQNFDLLTSTKGGRDLWVNVSVIGLPKKDKPLTLHLLRDVTRQEKSEEAMAHILSTLRGYGLVRGMREDNSAVVRTRTSSASPPNPFSALTRREVEILGLVAQGLSTQAIATKLGISPFTVRNHVRNILRKSGLQSRTQAVALALKYGLL